MTLAARASNVISCMTRRHNSSYVTGKDGGRDHGHFLPQRADTGEREERGLGLGGGGGRGLVGRRARRKEAALDPADQPPDDRSARSRNISPRPSPSKFKTGKIHFLAQPTNDASPPHTDPGRLVPQTGGERGERGDATSSRRTRGSSAKSSASEDSSHRQLRANMEPCLGSVDLVSLGVGSCLGTGMYLTTGLVAATMAGPGGVVSLLLAGLASGLTGLCYAELAGACPNTCGSAYMYAYVTVGELVAFVIGWGLVVEYVIGTAAGAVALSETVDALSGAVFSSFTHSVASFIGLPKLDLLAAVVCSLLTLLLASGVEMSARVNNGLNIVNIAVLVFFVAASFFLGSSRNWVAGGFFPFGLSGVVHAIPTSYYAYIGFDSVAAAGKEARNPTTTIPRSLLLSILFSCLAYVIVILALTFCLPFYKLHPYTAVMDVLAQVNFVPGQYVVAAGAVSGEFAATFGSMFPLPRVLAAMAADGLIFRPLSKICPKRHTALRATLLSGLVAMVMATFFDLQLLIELVLIGTLLAYILVTFALLYMRYVTSGESKLDGFETGSRDGVFYDRNSSSSGGVGDEQSGTAPITDGGDLRASSVMRPVNGEQRMVRPTDGEQRMIRPTDGERMIRPTDGEQRMIRPTDGEQRMIRLTDGEQRMIRPTGDPRTPYIGRPINGEQRKMRPTDSNLRTPSIGRPTDGKQRTSSIMPTTDSTQAAPCTCRAQRHTAPRKQLAMSRSRGASGQSRDASFGSRGRTWSRDVRCHAGTCPLHPSAQSSAYVKDSDKEDSVTDSDLDETILYEKQGQGHGHKTVRTYHLATNEPVMQTTNETTSTEKSKKTHQNKKELLFDLVEGQGEGRASKTRPAWLNVLADLIERTSASPRKVLFLLCALYAVILVLCVAVSQLWTSMADGSLLSLGLLGLTSAIVLVLVAILCFLPQTLPSDSFRAPLVPALPVCVAVVNIYLIVCLSPTTWLMFIVWMFVGLLVYFLYGMNHSQAGAEAQYTEIILLPDDDDDNDNDDDDVNDDSDDLDDDEERSLITK